jgi:hypothetical protein
MYSSTLITNNNHAELQGEPGAVLSQALRRKESRSIAGHSDCHNLVVTLTMLAVQVSGDNQVENEPFMVGKHDGFAVFLHYLFT